MKKFFKNFGPAILSEIKFFFLVVVPIGAILALGFLLAYAHAFLNKSDEQVFMIGFLLNAGGIYLMRIVSWLVKRRLSKRPEVQEDIYVAEEK